MEIEKGQIISSTLEELRFYWKEMGWDEDYLFEEYVEILKSVGVKIVE